MARFRIHLFCPDRHLSYDGKTPDQTGVGGGVTARIRLARALAHIRHEMTVICNCPQESTTLGVRYLPLDHVQRIDTDILILNSTGGALDLTPIMEYDVHARLRIAWVGGIPQVRGIHDLNPDFVYVPSNFMRGVLRDDWGVPTKKLATFYNGIESDYFRRGVLSWLPRRDPYRLVYTSHPAKGLDAAIGVMRLLRVADPRFELHVFGGTQLWGMQEQPPDPEPGLVYHGLVGQSQLARELRLAGISIHLQAIREAFGIGMAEAMAAGSIPVASPVGAYTELIESGSNGFLIPGDHLARETQAAAAETILFLAQEPVRAEGIRRNAQQTPIDWMTIARAWTGHWDWYLAQSNGTHDLPRMEQEDGCPECGGPHVILADGSHCTRCGLYTPPIPQSRTRAGSPNRVQPSE